MSNFQTILATRVQAFVIIMYDTILWRTLCSHLTTATFMLQSKVQYSVVGAKSGFCASHHHNHFDASLLTAAAASFVLTSLTYADTMK